MIWVALGAVVLAVATTGMILRVRQAWNHYPTYHDVHYRVRTLDGWDLSLFRYIYTAGSEKNETSNPRPVIILCHDIGGSPQLWEQDGPRSWPLQLKRLGYDVWSIGLRGTSSSEPNYLDVYHGWGWDLDAHLSYDLQAVLSTIQQHTKDAQRHWLGHGLGGAMGLIAHTQGKMEFSSITTINTGLKPLQRFRGLAIFMQWWPISFVPLHHFYRWSSPIRWLMQKFGRLRSRLFQQAQLPHAAFSPALALQLKPLSTQALRQALRWWYNGDWKLQPGQASLHKQLPNLSCPVRCISTPGSTQAPSHAVERLLQHLPESKRHGLWISNACSMKKTFPGQESKETQDIPVYSPNNGLLKEQSEVGQAPFGHYAPLLDPDLREILVNEIHSWHQNHFSPEPKKKRRRKSKKKTHPPTSPA